MSMNVNDYEDGGKTSGIVQPDFQTGKAYYGRVVSVINMGLQHRTMWDAKVKASKPLYWKPKDEQVKGGNNQTYADTGNPVTGVEFVVTFELPKLRVKTTSGDELGPMWQSKTYGPKSKELNDLLAGLNSHSVSDLINVPVGITLGLTGGGKPKITGVSLADEDEVTVAELENETALFDFYEPDMEVFNKLPKFRQNDLKKSLDFAGSKLEAYLSNVSQQEDEPEDFDDGQDNGPPF